MKYSILFLCLVLLNISCSKKNEPTNIVFPDPITPPAPPPAHENKKPKNNFYSCSGGQGPLVQLKIQWSTQTPLEEINQNPLEKCQNTPSSNSGTYITVTYPAQGTSLAINGKQVTKWMVATVTNEFGSKKFFYQYSNFIIRSSGCTQGQFMSVEKNILDIKIDEPSYGQGIATIGDESFVLHCE